MARSAYQSARKDIDEMYEHELEALAAELDGMIDELIASDNKATVERDRLAAENAELRQACNELSDDLSRMHQLELEAKCHGDLEKSHAIMVQVVAERDATLDRLREVVPEGWHWCADCEKMTPPDDEDPDFCGVCECENYWHRGVHVALQAILYPPETTNDDR